MAKGLADFQVFVKPVGALCNMACQYCYYLENGAGPQKGKNSPMSESVLEQYIFQHIEASEGPSIFFSWHGGEPTLAGLRYFENIVKIQQKHQPEGVSIVNGLQTNGTLLDENWCKFLADNHFMVGISIDGPEDLHTIYRGGKSGAPGFRETMRGYELLKAYGILCEILCVVNSANVEQPLRVYRFFKDLECEFISFLPLVERLPSGWEDVSHRSVSAKAFGRFLCAIFDEWKSMDIGRVKIQVFEEALRTAFDMDHTLCVFKESCGRVPVVEQNGDLYSCDHYVDSQHLIGNIRETPLAELLESRKQEVFGLQKLYLMPALCIKCEVRSMCNGGCPKDRFIKTHKGEPGLNYLCEGYKHFFKHCRPFVEQVAQVWKNSEEVTL